MSTSQNVDRVIRDFSNGNQQYAGAHLFFIDGASLSLRPGGTGRRQAVFTVCQRPQDVSAGGEADGCAASPAVAVGVPGKH